MLKLLHSKRYIQLILGLFEGIIFGFLLQKGGVTNYNVIIDQLLLKNFTVIKIMLSAIIVGMIGIYFLKGIGLVQLHPKPGSLGSSIIGGLIFGIGFALLGYCPGTAVGAVGQGSLDALVGGVVGMLIGAGLFAHVYPRIYNTVLNKIDFNELTLPKLFKINEWIIIIPFSGLLIAILILLEKKSL
ncbi:MAG: YeeE/YedE thiosulfate transporter family protein [bacterium]